MAVSFKKYTYWYLSSGTSHSFVDIKLSAFVFPLNRVVIFVVWALNRISYLSHTCIGSRLKTLVGDTHLSEIYGSAPGLKDSHTMLPSKDSVLKFYILCIFFTLEKMFVSELEASLDNASKHLTPRNYL